MGLLEAVGLAVDGDDLGIVHQAIDQRDDAGGVGEHLAPLGEWPVGGDDGAVFLITPRDQLEHQVGVAVGRRFRAHVGARVHRGHGHAGAE